MALSVMRPLRSHDVAPALTSRGRPIASLLGPPPGAALWGARGKQLHTLRSAVVAAAFGGTCALVALGRRHRFRRRRSTSTATVVRAAAATALEAEQALAEGLEEGSPHPEVPAIYATLLGPVLPADFSWEEFVEASKRPLRPCVRINPVKATAESISRYAAKKEWRLLEAVPWTDGPTVGAAGTAYWVEACGVSPREQLPTVWQEVADVVAPSAVESSPVLEWSHDAAHFCGDLYVQESASLLPVAALLSAFQGQAPEGALVLDMAAAPGGKTTALAAWVAKAGGAVVANEPSGSRSKALADNLLRLGVMPWTMLTQLDGKYAANHWPETFHAILLDAPCSGEALSRRGKTSYQDQTYTYAYNLSMQQQQLIESAFRSLREGGVLVYSTCTLNPVENEQVVQHLTETFGDAVEPLPLDELPGVDGMRTPEGYLRCWPHISDTQSFFVARVRKARRLTAATIDAESTDGSYDKRKRRTVWEFMEAVPRKEARDLERAFRNNLSDLAWPPGGDGAVAPKGLALRRRGGFIWLCPEVLGPLAAAGMRRAGVRLADEQNVNLRYAATHEWCVSFAHNLPPEAACFAPLSIEAATDFCEGAHVPHERKQAEPQGADAAGAKKAKKAKKRASLAGRDGTQAVASFEGRVLGMGRWDGKLVHNDTPRHWRCERIAL